MNCTQLPPPRPRKLDKPDRKQPELCNLISGHMLEIVYLLGNYIQLHVCCTLFCELASKLLITVNYLCAFIFNSSKVCP